jgi:tetratricopeptide (TPR) repeat protein
MRRLDLAVILLTLASVVPASAGDLTPEAAFGMVARSTWSREPLPKPDELAAARKVLEAQAAKEPGDAKWTFALGRAASFEANQVKGDAGANKRKDALARLERAVELQPGNAEYRFWVGSAAFDCMNDVGMLSKVSLASEGRKAFEKAVALDPSHIAARVGLARYYLAAPGIAGGSVAKAREQGEQILAMPGQRGDFQGRMVLAGIAAHEENWTEMARQYIAAETATGEGAEPAVALRSHAVSLLNQKKDATAALPIVERYVKTAPADDLTALYLDGEVKRQLGRCADALPRFEQVLASLDGARGSRWGAAVCREKLGQKDAARHDYEEYLRRFPDDDRSKEAKAAIKRLSGS